MMTMRVLAAELEAGGLDVTAGQLADERADRGRPGETHLVDDVLGQPRLYPGECRLAVGEHEVEDPGREPAGDEQLVEGRGDSRGVLRRLPHRRVAADKRRHEVPRRDGDGKVARRDDRDGADRHPVGEKRLVVHLGGNRLPVQTAPLAEEEVACVDDLLHLAEGFGIGLAHLTGHKTGEGLLVRLHEAADLGYRPAPDGCGHVRPRLLSGLGDPTRIGESGAAGEGDVRHDVIEMGGVGRAHVLEVLAHGLAADDQKRAREWPPSRAPLLQHSVEGLTGQVDLLGRDRQRGPET